MTVEEAKSRGRNIISAKYPMTANGKTLLSGGERGFVKILADEQTGQIAGAQLMCERASDLVSLFGEALHLMHGKKK